MLSKMFPEMVANFLAPNITFYEKQLLGHPLLQIQDLLI